jgi:hypothetical protein
VDTEGELAGALAALQRRSPEELATFIVSLLYGAPPGVRSYVEAFIAAAERVSKILCARHSMRTWSSYVTQEEEPGGRCRPAEHSL